MSHEIRPRRLGRIAIPAVLLHLHHSEDGLLSFVSIIVFLFVVVLIGLVGNVGYLVTRKVEVQNSADAAAYTGAIWLARGMNVITATNHLIGEMQALVVLHAAIGGEELEGKQPLDPAEASQAKAHLQSASDTLRRAWTAAKAAQVLDTPADPNGNDLVGEEVTAGATVRAAMTDLKNKLAVVYVARAGASVAEHSGFPPAMAIGGAADAVATGVELLILAEYRVLKLMEQVARQSIPFRDLLFTQLLPNASAFERLAVDSVPTAAAGAAAAIAQGNDTSGAVYPAEPKLPVFSDQADGPFADGDLPTAPLVRTSFPWVAYDRTPVLRLTKWMIFSHTADHYANYTDRYTLLKAKELYQTGFTMYVMTKRDEAKGSEPWTSDSRLANRKFTLLGFAHRPSRTLMSPAIFGTPNTDGVVACAQAMVYNANRQDPGAGLGTFQPEVGWDTLNWEPPITASGAYEYSRIRESDTCPRYKVNWQAKLVPVSRLDEAARSGQVAGPCGAVLGRLGSGSKSLLTH